MVFFEAKMKKLFVLLFNLIFISILCSISVFAEETEQVLYNAPNEIKGVIVTPGDEFADEAGQSEETVKAQIDKIISNMVDYELNTVYVNLQNRDGVIYKSDYYPMYTSFDALQYFTDKAKENDIFVYGIINPCYAVADDILYEYGYINSEIITQATENVEEIVKNYNLDAVLIEGYYNSITESSFEQYKIYSAGMGFEQWINESATSLIRTLSDTVEKNSPEIQFGLVCDSVWANSSTTEKGSATSADFEMYTDGFVDLFNILDSSNVKTILVDLPGAIANKQIPFKSTLKWWKNTAKEYDADVAALIYNSKLSSDETGWASPDQVLQQLIAMREVDAKGAVFASYEHLEKNPDGHTDLLVRFYKDQIKVQDILTTLTVSRPEKLVYSTYEPNVSFYGASDPNFPLLLNGEKVSRNEKGVFSLEIELKAGENVFTFEHKTKTVTYKITRNIKIFQSVSPEGSMTVEGDSVVTISAYAYKDSEITAKINGTKIKLIASDKEGDETDKNSSYILYTGDYQVPSSQSESQDIGKIKFTGIWQGIEQEESGARIKITALPPPEIEVGEKGNMIEVTASQARTYPASVLNADPSGDCFPLPKGSRDFIASDLLSFTSGSTTYQYYILRSGVRVNAADVKVIGEKELVANKITNAEIYSESGYIYLKLKQEQPMAYRAYLKDLVMDAENGISSFNSDSVRLEFKNVEEVCEVSVSDNNIFSKAKIDKDDDNATVKLYLHKGGRFAGYKAYYDGEYLIFRFTNVPSGISGAKIYLDPGHGGYDSGALPIEGMKTEAQINREIAMKVKAILEERGASVQITDTTSYVSLDSRVSASQSYKPHLFVSIHQNSSTSPSAHGTEAWYFNPYSEIYADKISSSLASALGTRDRGEKYGWYKVTTHMEFPAILVECGFLSNVDEYDKLKNDDYQNAMAKAIADGIAAAFGAM